MLKIIKSSYAISFLTTFMLFIVYSSTIMHVWLYILIFTYAHGASRVSLLDKFAGCIKFHPYGRFFFNIPRIDFILWSVSYLSWNRFFSSWPKCHWLGIQQHLRQETQAWRAYSQSQKVKQKWPALSSEPRINGSYGASGEPTCDFLL